MAISFILLSPSLFFFIPLEGVNITFEGDDSLLLFLLIRHTNKAWFAHDIIIVTVA